jgi:predicted RNase H-like HicB family nuclease
LPSPQIKLHIIVEKDSDSGWFTATCPALPGCVTQAETEEELLENIKEAVSLWLEVQDEKEMLAANSTGDKPPSSVHELALSF